MYSKTIDDVIEYIERAVAGYEDDPADTPFQDGYLQALLVLREWITE